MNLTELEYWVDTHPIPTQINRIPLQEVIPKILKTHQTLKDTNSTDEFVTVLIHGYLNNEEVSHERKLHVALIDSIVNNKEFYLKEVLHQMHKDIIKLIADKYLRLIEASWNV